jgi:hypothetical protein
VRPTIRLGITNVVAYTGLGRLSDGLPCGGLNISVSCFDTDANGEWVLAASDWRTLANKTNRFCFEPEIWPRSPSLIAVRVRLGTSYYARAEQG